MDTIVVSSREENFARYFIGERSWYPVRIDDRRIDQLQWIAIYRSTPVRAITHLARIKAVYRFEDSGRYRIDFDEPQELDTPVPSEAGAPSVMQGQRYTSLVTLKNAKTLADLRNQN